MRVKGFMERCKTKKIVLFFQVIARSSPKHILEDVSMVSRVVMFASGYVQIKKS